MLTVQLQLSEKIVQKVASEALTEGLSFSEYIESRLGIAPEDSGDHQPLRIQQNAAAIASGLFSFALDQPQHPITEEGDMESNEYLTETLYKNLSFATEWGTLDRGLRIMIGKAFKRQVDSQPDGGTLVDEETGYCMKVVFVRLSKQNQSIYKTVRSA